MKDEQIKPPKEIWSIDDVMHRLLPCPFCGEKPEIDKSYMPSEVDIRCTNNHCHVQPSIYESVTCIPHKPNDPRSTYSPMFEWHYKIICEKWNKRNDA